MFSGTTNSSWQMFVWYSTPKSLVTLTSVNLLHLGWMFLLLPLKAVDTRSGSIASSCSVGAALEQFV
jgi:hypothetical protein